ncbi:MAG: DNA repair protein RecO, partial [Thermomicrobiaceae bacterium]|nr:DNA repair protein RecO [Thermomicrobiaceae bacterium]
LRRRDLGEADRILTLFTEQYGKLRVVAKGARRTKSRLAGHLEPFSRTRLLLAQGRNLDIVTQAQLVDPYRGLRLDEARIAYAGYLADLLDALTVEEQENAAAYALLAGALDRLSRGADPYVTVRAFELGLLTALGFQPELQKCVACGRVLEPVENAFSPHGGGVLCPECAAHDPAALPLSVNALKLLRLLRRGDLATADRLRLSDTLKREVEEALLAYLRHLLERDLDSFAVLKSLTH